MDWDEVHESLGVDEDDEAQQEGTRMSDNEISGPYDGQNLATHSLTEWIINEGKLIDDARNSARADEDTLRDYVKGLLFEGKGFPKTRDDKHNLRIVLDLLGEAADSGSPTDGFKIVNWTYIRSELLAE
ncbi:hypothetical protein ACH427_04480 [Streptomyces sp. NPDC020379]|uniref:hypothetical protein n=1 Tax=Streptomyces sp. NPDC020379 TaxID=3365071 RepID=UPI00379F09A5